MKKKTNKKSSWRKKALELDMLGWWIIAIVVLVILVIAVILLRGKGSGALEYIKELFRFKGAG